MPVPLKTHLTRSPAAIGALVLCLAALLSGLFGAGMLATSGYRAYLLQDLTNGGITAPDARQTYLLLRVSLLLLAPFGAGLMAFCLGKTLRGQPLAGMNALSTAAEWLEKLWTALGAVLAAVFLVRTVAYAAACLQRRDGAYLLYAMVISEGMMGALAAFVFFLLRRFLGSLCDASSAMAYSAASGKLQSIPSFAATGFALLGAVCLFQALDQFFTITIAVKDFTPYYKLLTAGHPAQIASAIAFLCCAGANMLLYGWLRQYQRLTERLLYQMRRQARTP